MPIEKLLGGLTVMFRLLEMGSRNVLGGRRIEPVEAAVQPPCQRDGQDDSLYQVLSRARLVRPSVIVGLLQCRLRVERAAGMPNLQPLQIGGAIAQLAQLALIPLAQVPVRSTTFLRKAAGPLVEVSRRDRASTPDATLEDPDSVDLFLDEAALLVPHPLQILAG